MTNYDDVTVAGAQSGVAGLTDRIARTRTEAGAEIAAESNVRSRGANQRWSRCLTAGLDALDIYRREHKADLLQFEDIWFTMDQVSPSVMAQTLWQLGWLRHCDETITAERVVETSNLDNRHAPLIAQWLEVLAVQGLLQRASIPDTYCCPQPLNASDVRKRVERAVFSLNPNRDYPGFVEYFKACVTQQLALLTGKANPRKLLFPAGNSRNADALYRYNPVSAMQNRIAAAVLGAICGEWSSKRKLAVLEVGGGTGATTAVLLPELPADRTRYCFTDVSRFFTKRAAEQFAHFSFVEYDLLDIDRDPLEQGYEPQSFDVIVAANVLHTARYIERSLARLRNLLSRSGVLIAIETTSNTALQMLTLGHFDGVSHFEDDRRTANLPFLPMESWQSSLLAAGFADVGAVPRNGAASQAWPQHVLLARADAP